MHTRPVTPADFTATASVSVDCFWDDELYTYTNPWREQYLSDFRDSFLRRHQLRYWSPGFVFHVAVTDDGDAGHEEGGRVVGYAIWYRVGKSEDASQWRRQTFQSYVERALLLLTDKYVHYTGADKSLDYERLQEWLAASLDEFGDIPEMWKLQNLCVEPRFQRRGIGGLLMQWGKEQAEKEGCPIGLTSSMKGSGLYLKNGFRRYATIRIKDFPVGDVPVFLWEPPGTEGKWGTRGDMTVHQ